MNLRAVILVFLTGSLMPASIWGGEPLIRINRDGQTLRDLEFRDGRELAAQYHVSPELAKPCMWPLHAPGAIPVTRAWPFRKGTPGETTDHVHQKSVWFCHGDVIPEGMTLATKVKGVTGVDFWAEGRGHGRIVCTIVDQPVHRPDHAKVLTRNEWLTADGQKVLDEVRTIALYPRDNARLFVFDIELHASVYPLVFGDTKEGSFGIRVHDALREIGGNGKLVNAEGKTGMKAIWGYPSAWCDYSGFVDGQAVGAAILDHPANRFPACWHSRDYGLMAANPFARQKSGFPAMTNRSDLCRLEVGKRLKLRYGLLVHLGNAVDAKVSEHYQYFIGLQQ